MPDNTRPTLEENALLELDQQAGAAPAWDGIGPGQRPARPGVAVVDQPQTARRAIDRPLARALVVGVTGALLAIAAWEAWVLATSLSRPDVTLGMDFRLYVERAQAWLGGEGFYLPLQLAGRTW